MNSYFLKRAQLLLIEFKAEVARDRLMRLDESILKVSKDGMSNTEYKEFLLYMEKELKCCLINVDRIPQQSKCHYLFKITKVEPKIKEPIPQEIIETVLKSC